MLHCNIAVWTPMADLNRTIDRSKRISRSVSDLYQQRVRAAGERFVQHGREARERAAAGSWMPKTPFEFWRQWSE